MKFEIIVIFSQKRMFNLTVPCPSSCTSLRPALCVSSLCSRVSGVCGKLCSLQCYHSPAVSLKTPHFPPCSQIPQFPIPTFLLYDSRRWNEASVSISSSKSLLPHRWPSTQSSPMESFPMSMSLIDSSRSGIRLLMLQEKLFASTSGRNLISSIKMI